MASMKLAEPGRDSEIIAKRLRFFPGTKQERKSGPNPKTMKKPPTTAGLVDEGNLEERRGTRHSTSTESAVIRIL